MYYVKMRDGRVIENLSMEDINKLDNWSYIGTMEGLQVEKAIKALPKGERLK